MSAHWQTLRQTVIRKRGPHCERCHRTDHLHLHHRTYQRLGAEHEDDVLLLCASCHSTAHLFNATAHARGAKRAPGSRVGSGRSDTFKRPELALDERLKKPRRRL